jgi:hypothetical protein
VIIDWNHIYIVWWYDKFGRKCYAPSYVMHGSRESMTNVWVTGPAVGISGPPLLRMNRINYQTVDKFQMHDHHVPESVRCCGWYIEEGFERTDDPNDVDVPRKPSIAPKIYVEPDNRNRFERMGVRHGN